MKVCFNTINRRCFVMTLLFVCFIFRLSSQDTLGLQTVVDSLILESNNKYLSKNYSEALIDVEKMIGLYEENNVSDQGYARSLYMNGYTLAALKNYTEAKESFERSISIYNQLQPSSKYHFSAYSELANVYRKLFDKEKAKENYVKSLDLRLKYFDSSDEETLNKLVVIAGSLYRVGTSELTLKYFSTILDSFKVNNLESHFSLFGIYNISGIISKNEGNYDLAFKNYKQAERILSYNNAEESYKASLVYNNYGILNKLNSNYEEAIKNYTKALSIQRKIYKNQPHKFTSVLCNLAQIHSRLGNEKLSIDYANQAVDLSKQGYGEASSKYLMSYMFREEVFYTLNTKSILIYEENYFDSLYTKVHNDLDYNYLKFKAAMFRKAKHYDRAAEILDQGIAKYNQGLGSFLHQSFRDPINLYASLGDVYRESYFDNSRTFETLAKSGEAYDVAVKHLANSKKQIHLTSSASAHINSMSFILKDAMISYHELFDITSENKYLNKMLQVSSLIKNIDLDIKMSSANALEFANVSKSEIQEIDFINNQRDSIEKDISALSGKLDTQFVDLHEALISLNTERDNWFKGIETKYPEYYSFKHGYWNKSLEELKKEKIKEDELLIDYVQFDSLFYVISVSKEKELSRAFIMDSTFISQLSMFKFNSDLKDLSKTDEVLNVLYKLLIRDEIEFHGPSIQKITISTDSNLSAFPFEILLADDYLVKKYDFRYIHSVDFNYKHFGKPKKPIGVFAPQYNALKAIDVSYNQPLAMLVRDGEWMLPGAQEESAMIASLFDGEIFTGGLSSLSNFILEAPNYRSLHLSMHTIASDSVKSGFALVFPNESISTDFDLLKDNDIYDLKLNAEMVVLSACNTGKGTYKKGIGVKSLANSFFYAGVPSTVMSFWKVPDEQTSKIMINFYENLKKGNSKSNALRNAKIDYLNNVQTDELKHPYYWSGFVLIGNDDPIDLSNKAMLYKYLGLFIFLIIATYLIFFKRK